MAVKLQPGTTDAPQKSHPPKDLQGWNAAEGKENRDSSYPVGGDGNGAGRGGVGWGVCAATKESSMEIP